MTALLFAPILKAYEHNVIGLLKIIGLGAILFSIPALIYGIKSYIIKIIEDKRRRRILKWRRKK